MTDEGWELLWWTLPTSIVVFAVVSAVARVVRKRWSRTGWFRLLGSPALLFPTGIHGAATRDDVRRRATRLTLAGPALVGVAIVVGNASARFEPLSRASLSFQVYAGIVGTVGVVVFLFGLANYGNSLLHRRPVLATTEQQLLGMAAELESIASALELELEWPDFDAVNYTDPRLERVRQAIAARFPRGVRPSTPDDAAWLRSQAAELRASIASAPVGEA